MKRRILSLLMCLTVLLPLLALSASAMTPDQAADVDGDGAVTARDAAILARFAAGWDGYVDARGHITFPWKTGSLKDGKYVKNFEPTTPVDFGGRTFRVLSWGGTDNGTRVVGGQTVQNFSITHFSVKDVCPWTTGNWSDSGNYARYYTKLSEVVAERNAYLESTYNCHIEEVRVAEPFGELLTDTFSGADSYDLALVPGNRSSNGLNSLSQMTFGLYENVLKIPTVDVSKPWYETDLLRGLTCEDKLLFLAGASDSSIRQAVFLPLIGLKNLSDAYNNLSDEKAAADYVYDLVFSGEWTVEKMTQILQTCYSAYGNKTGKYTYSAASYSNILFALGAGFTAYDAASGDLYETFSQCPGAEAWEDLADLLCLHRNTTENDLICGGLSGSTGIARAIGVTVYCYKSNYNYSTTGNWVAAVPFPKANADQASYITQANLSFSCFYVIPVANAACRDASQYGFESGRDMEGYFISAYMEASLGEHNSKGYDVRDALLYQLVSRLGFHNDTLKTELYPQGKALASIQTAYAALTVDPITLYEPAVYTPLQDCGTDSAKWSNPDASYDSKYSTQSENLKSLIKFLSIDE